MQILCKKHGSLFISSNGLWSLFDYYDRRDQSKSVNEVLLLSCVKDIERHKSLWYFNGVNGEKELILLRARICMMQHYVRDLPFVPFIVLSSNTCRVLNEIAHHSQGKRNKKSAKGDKGVASPCTDCTLDQ